MKVFGELAPTKSTIGPMNPFWRSDLTASGASLSRRAASTTSGAAAAMLAAWLDTSVAVVEKDCCATTFQPSWSSPAWYIPLIVVTAALVNPYRATLGVAGTLPLLINTFWMNEIWRFAMPWYERLVEYR